jgi:lysozyme
MWVHGIDVSGHQGEIDWERVAKGAALLDGQGRQAACAFAIVKVSEGDDPTYRSARRNIEGARDAGLLVGAYHFATLYRGDDGDAIDEAEAFCEALALSGAMTAKLLALDLEKLGEVKQHMNPREAEAWVWAWLGYVDAHTSGQILIYGRRLPKWMKARGLDAYPLWVPRYGVNKGEVMGDPGTLPQPWQRWTMHQYTSKGRCKGIEGDVDLNVVRPVDYRRLSRARRAVPIVVPLVGSVLD